LLHILEILGLNLGKETVGDHTFYGIHHMKVFAFVSFTKWNDQI